MKTNNKEVVTLYCKDSFSAAHFLPDHPKCGMVHGHNYKVMLIVESIAGVLEDNDMLIDFGILKKLLTTAIEPFDHNTLNSLPEFNQIAPTAEQIAWIILKTVESAIDKEQKQLIHTMKVRVEETDRYAAEVSMYVI